MLAPCAALVGRSSRSRSSTNDSAGSGKLRLETIEVGDDQPVTRLGVGRGEYGLDLRDGHLQAPQPADDLRDRDLILGVVAIAVAGVDLAGLQQPDVVVVAQRLDAQLRCSREVADRDAGSSCPQYRPSPCRRVNRKRGP